MAAIRPFTVAHFERYVANIVLDTGAPWRLEDFQAEVVEPVLAGVPEVWAILPEGNAKTTLLAGLALYCADYAPLPWIPIAASSRDQAEIMAQQAYQMVRSSPGMLRRFRIYEGYRRIQPIRPDHPNPGTRGIKVYPADVATGDGVIPYPLAICDEGHRHPDMRLYRLWKGKLKKRGATIAMISTAGEPGTEFEQMRDAIRDSATLRRRAGAHGRYERRGVVMNEWMVATAEQATDMHEVKQANPLAAITEADLHDLFDSPTTDLGEWRRLKCNQPARALNAAVSEAEWDAAYLDLPLPEGMRIDVGIDVAWKWDTFAITPCWDAPMLGFRLLGPATILTPPRDGSMLHPDIVKAALENILDRNPVDTAVMDMQRAEDVAAWLETEHGVKVVDRGQGNALAAADFEAFTESLRDGTLRHNGHSGLRAHVMHAVARSLPGGKRRFDRPSQSRAGRRQDERVTDALTAAAMVNWFQRDRAKAPSPLAGDPSDYRIQQL